MKVSIIIPVYQVSEYIERCVRSVMNQTYATIECILVDDCGKDDSITKCEQLIQKYNGPIEFVILHQKENRGASVARNWGIRQARGEWLYFLDSDDEIMDNCIELLVEAATKSEAIEMVQGVTIEYKTIEVAPGIYEQRRDLMRSCVKLPKAPSAMTNNETIRRWFFKEKALSIISTNKLLKRSFIMQNHLLFKEGVVLEDNLFSFYMYKYLAEVRIVKEITYIYHIRSCSVTTGTSPLKRANNYGEIIIEILSHLTPSWEKEEMSYFLGRFINICAFMTHKDIMSKHAFSFYWKQAWEFHCWTVLIDLSFAYIASYFRNSHQVYRKLSRLKRCVFKCYGKK